MKEKDFDVNLDVNEEENEKDLEAKAKAEEQRKLEESERFSYSLNVLFEEFMDIGSYLEELHVLRRMEKLLDLRIKSISPDALAEGCGILQSETPQRESGAFEFNGLQFEISAKRVFDFTGHAPRYTMPEGVEYRALFNERTRLRDLSSSKTEKMAAIVKAFPIEHPDWEPDWTELTVKCK